MLNVQAFRRKAPPRSPELTRNPAPVSTATLRPHKGGEPEGFTLIELLVVVTIIVVLLALLTPALDRAVATAERARCGANLKGAGIAVRLYLQDSNQFFPGLKNWGKAMGNLGATGHYASSTIDTDDRPLNAYLGYRGKGTRVPVAQCPSDTGDSHRDITNPPVNNAYEAYGTSYLGAEVAKGFRIQPLFGGAWSPAFPAMSMRRVTRTDNKIVLADWPHHGNRPWSDIRTRWHDNGDPDVRQFNTLFSDSHVEWFAYPVAEIEEAYGWTTHGGDASWKWW